MIYRLNINKIIILKTLLNFQNMLRHLKMGPPSPKKTVEFGLVRVNSDKTELNQIIGLARLAARATVKSRRHTYEQV